MLRPAPTGPFTITAKINHKGLVQYQQAGIIVYGTDDNYVKLDRTASNTPTAANTEFFEFIQEVNATARNATPGPHREPRGHVPAGLLPADRLERHHLTGQYSTDGHDVDAGRPDSTALPANARVGVHSRLQRRGHRRSSRRSTGSRSTDPNVPARRAPNADPVISSATRTPAGDVTTGTAVEFTAAATDADGDTLTYAWEFGDGGTVDGAEPVAHLHRRRHVHREGDGHRRQGRHRHPHARGRRHAAPPTATRR